MSAKKSDRWTLCILACACSRLHDGALLDRQHSQGMRMLMCGFAGFLWCRLVSSPISPSHVAYSGESQYLPPLCCIVEHGNERHPEQLCMLAHDPHQSSLLHAELSDSAAAPSTLFRVSGRRVKANLAKHALCWQFDSRSCFPRQHQAVNTGQSVQLHAPQAHLVTVFGCCRSAGC